MTQELRFKNMEEFGFGPNVMKQTKVCPQCGQVIKAAASYCFDCGAKLPAETLYDRYKQRHLCCPVCDTVLTSGVQYCPNCGTRILPKAAGCGKGGG